MAELGKPKRRVVNAMLDRKGRYVKIDDWEGKSLTFILADEIITEEKPDTSEQKIDKK